MPGGAKPAPGKPPWWFMAARSRRGALVGATWWLLFGALGVVNVTIASSATLRWIGAVQSVCGFVLSGMCWATARYMEAGRGRPQASP